MDPVVAWDDDGTPRSPRFDDLYHRTSGAAEQARHVFLQGCGLPLAWAQRPSWRILEAGFGLGLNFMVCWQAWRNDPQRPRLLHYAAIDAWPVEADDLLRSVAALPELQPLAQALAARWQGLAPGFHRITFEEGRVLLTLAVGDVAPMLRAQAFHPDAVFLDGFRPERNPQMWSLDTLKAVTRLCRRGTALATWTAADPVQRDLRTLDWQLERRPGLPPGPEGLAARYAPGWPMQRLAEETVLAPGQCIVLGAGLAGAAVAASLARRGWQVQVLDAAAQPAAGASGLPVGLLAPQQSPDDNPLSRLSRAGIRITLAEAQARLAPGLEWEHTGVLEWRGDDHRPLPPLGAGLDAWSRPATEAQLQAAGLAPGQPAWWHGNAAWIEPAALVRSWLRTPGVRFQGGLRVQRLRPQEGRWILEDDAGRAVGNASHVVVATALASADLLAQRIAVQPVRGQLTWAPRGDDADALPPFPVNGHGHFLPRVPLVDRQAWITGSSYGQGDAGSEVRGADTAANLQRVRELLPRAASVVDGAAARGELRAWSGVRCASTDRRPLVGEVAPGLWVSTAMGSRGLSFAALCAELLAAQLHGEPLPVEAKLARALDVRRQSGPARPRRAAAGA